MSNVDIGRVGIWTFAFESLRAGRAQELAAEIESLGFGAIWIPEAVGRDAIAGSALLLAGTERITVATGIATIWGRDPMTMAAGHRTVSEWFPGRFLLGIGVSHAPLVEGLRRVPYDKPYSKMASYVDAMATAAYAAPAPEPPARLVLAALGSKMLRLAAERTEGAHPYFVPPEHTAVARDVMGPDALLAPEQAVVLETDPEAARTIARGHMATYLTLPNYVNNLRRLGFGDDDVNGGGSDRLVDAIVAWGDEAVVVERVRAHHDAGADHVSLQVLTPDPLAAPVDAWRRLAAALL